MKNKFNAVKIGIVAGEASGDLLGAELILALRTYQPDLKVVGIGGPAMIAAGCESLFDIERLAVMGLIEPLLHLRDLFKLRRDLYQHFITNRPDVFIGIDAPDFNLGLEKKLRQAGIKIVHYVSPSVWAWRRYRIKKIAKAVNLMLTLLPFEEKFYRQHQIPVHYVGHPLASQIPLCPDQAASKKKLGLDKDIKYIALLPGSRRQEIRYMAKNFLMAAKLILEKKPTIRFLTTHINEQRYQEFYNYYEQCGINLPIHFFLKSSREVMEAAEAIVVTSGTATLETMLYKKPMVIAYRMSPITYWLAKKLVKIPYIGLPNLLANQALVPELIQADADPKNIARHILNFLDDPKGVANLQNKFLEIHRFLQIDSAQQAGCAILKLINNTAIF